MKPILRWIAVASVPLAGWAAPQPASAAPSTGHTYIVNSTLDEPDADPSNGVCSSTPSGKCTLRAAIMESNFAADPNTIILPAGTYVLTRPGYDDGALIGDLDIGHDLTIQGAGSGATIVDGNGAVTGDRVFQVLSTTLNVTFSGLTIQNGQALSIPAGVIRGGGIYMEGAGHLSLSDVILEGNQAKWGAGMYANFSTQGGSLEMDHVIVRANTTIGEGGGVYADLPSSLSEFAVRDSQVYSNTAGAAGGGISVVGDPVALAHLTIERSQIYSNTAAYGGGIATFLPLALSDSRLHDNHASFQDGGAIEAFAPLDITRTTLDANTAMRYGGGIYSEGGVNIVESTLSGNSAQHGGGIYYRGFQTNSSLLTLVNSTLSNNTAYRPVGATGSADGGGLYVYGGQAQLFNTTIASNRVAPIQPGIGAGLYLTASAVLTAQNSLIANNVRGLFIQPVLDDCFSSGTVGTLAYDLILTTTNCFVSGPQGGNIVGQAPLIGPLQNNGGSTQTRALLPGSPAIHAGAPGGCTDDLGGTLTTDQRGAPRPASGCDIGAYEVVPEADLAVAKHGSSNKVLVGTPLTYTIAVTNNGPVMATGVMLTDTLPVSVTLSTAASTQGSCTGTVTVTCNLGSLASSSILTVTLAVTPTATGLITNTVTVTANEFDPVLANNTASETTAVLHQLYLPLITRGP